MPDVLVSDCLRGVKGKYKRKGGSSVYIDHLRGMKRRLKRADNAVYLSRLNSIEYLNIFISGLRCCTETPEVIRTR